MALGSKISVLIAFEAWLALVLWTASDLSSVPIGMVIAANPILSNETFQKNVTTITAANRGRRQEPFFLGVMVDAGKHEFSNDWILSFMGDVHRMGFNTLHLTLASDQRFAFSFNDTKEKGSHIHNGTLDLKALADNARSLDNMTILPEIPILFSTASWASMSGINFKNESNPTTALAPLPCPLYICSEARGLPISGTNLPLDIRSPHVGDVLRGVLQTLVERLQNPAYLHLGGYGRTSSNIDHGCWKEVLEETDQEQPDYETLETTLAGIVANDLGYKPRVIRNWEDVSDNKRYPDEVVNATLWQFQHHQQHANGNQSYLLQPKELDLATRLLKDHSTGWAVYQDTLKILEAHKSDYSDGSLLGMMISTQALPPYWFQERNAMGRLLAISMAVKDFESSFSEIKDRTKRNSTSNTTEKFEIAYRLLCDELFPAQSFCNRLGGLNIDPTSLASEGGIVDPITTNIVQEQKERNYKKDYANIWQGWAKDACHRLTETRDEVHVQTPTANVMQPIRESGFSAYWRDPGIGVVPENQDGGFTVKKEERFEEVFGHTKIPFRGFIVDLVEEPTPSEVLEELMEQVMMPLGLNTLQLSLMNHLGCALELESLEGLYFMVPKPPKSVKPLSETILQQIVVKGDRLGIELIPEISVTTQATGWFHAGFLVDCPNTLCSTLSSGGFGVTNDVNHGSLLPLILEVLRRLRTIFRSSSFLHLGSDERSSSEACWKESGRTPDHNRFERILSNLLEAKMWYNSSRILRWENSEGIVYPERTGMITQYRYGRNPYTIHEKNASTPAADGNHIFGSVSITPEKDPWTVYQETRTWIENDGLSPRGVLARIRLNKKVSTTNQYKSCILAFVIGLSSKAPVLDDASSLSAYISDTVCAGGNLPHLCPSPSDEGGGRIQPIATPREKILCKAMTHTISRTVMRSEPLALTSLDNEAPEASQ